MVIAYTDEVRVFIDVPELEAALVDVGDLVTLRVQALGGKELQKPVTRTSWTLDPSNRSLRVEVDVPNGDFLLRPGMYAAATIVLERRDNALALPTAALFRVGDQTCCCCIEAGKIERRAVEVGIRSGKEIEVLGGIDESSAVVLARADSLREGQAVELLATP